MNFFKSVFSDDPDPQPESRPTNNLDPNPSPPELSPATAARGGAWNFGGLIKTLTSKSESIIETYRRDLQEFGTGLKKEIEVAHGSVGHVIDELGTTVAKGTAQIVSKSKDAILAVDPESDSDHSSSNDNSISSHKYSRFDAAVRAIQGDAGTYCEEPEDLEEYNEWKLGFSIDGKSEEMERLLKENEAMEGVYKRVVPSIVDHEGFWLRYYYKVYRMKKAEDVRNRIVRRISKEEEEDLSWDVEDDGDDGGETKQEVMIDKEVGGGENMGKRVDEGGTKRLNNVEEVQGSGEEGLEVERRDNLLERKELGNKVDKFVEESQVEESGGVCEVGGGGRKETVEEAGVGEVSKLEVDNAVSKNDDSAEEFDEKVITERKSDDAKSCDKSNESSVVGSKHLVHEEEEEDEEGLGWDEIEDLSSIDEKKVTQSGNSISKVDLRKRLSAAEEEEDLSWDIEDDDDEPAKA